MSDSMVFNANISYQYSFSIFESGNTLSDDEKFEMIRSSILRRFPGSVTDTDPGAKDEKVFYELATIQSFLHGGGLPFPCRRMLIKGIGLSFPLGSMKESAILLTIFPGYNTAQLQLCFNVTSATTDQLIYLRQIFAGSAEFKSSYVVSQPLSAWSSEILSALGCAHGVPDLTYLIEIKSFGNCTDLQSILKNESRRLYGIICGDEGWEYVPEELAQDRISNQWGSRNFVKFIMFGTNAMLLNLNSSPEAGAYLARQHRFGDSMSGGVNPYFLLDSSVAGINHGIFLSQEMVLVIKTMANSILSRQNSFAKGTYIHLGQSIRKTKAYRTELISTLNRLESIGITELGEMEQMLINSYKITSLIENIKYLLELLESDLDLLYQQSTNRLVNILTIAGLMLSVLGVLIDFGIF